MLGTVLNIVLFLVAGLCAVGAVLFLVRSLAARTGIKKRTYGVERQDARQEMLVYAFASAGLSLMMILFCGLGAVAWLAVGDDDPNTAVLEQPLPTATTPAGGVAIPLENEVTPSPLPTAEQGAPTATEATAEPPSPGPTTESVAPATPTPLPTVTLEPTPARTTAVVNSPVVGLYLRTAPGGDIVERLEDQAAVILLGPEQTVDDILWVEVTAESSGNSGWVAADYLAEAGSVPPVEGGETITETNPITDTTTTDG